MVSSSVIRISNELFAKFKRMTSLKKGVSAGTHLRIRPIVEHILRVIAQSAFTGRTGMP